MIELTREDKIKLCAMSAHEMNRIYNTTIGEYDQYIWSLAPEWQRISAIKGVEGVLKGNDPKQSHENWIKEKIETGWKYGPVKDPIKKEHPCLVDYDKLSLKQKMKDMIFVNTVKTMAMALNLIN